MPARAERSWRQSPDVVGWLFRIHPLWHVIRAKIMSSSLRGFAFLLAALFVVCGVAMTFPQPAAPEALGELLTGSGPVQVILDNGLKVLIQTRTEASFIHLGLFYSAGSAREPDSLAGLAHLVEHLMFTSSENHPAGGLRRKLALYAAYANASTWQYGMVMRTVCLPQFLPEVLRLEADRMARLSPSPDELAREKQVVREELALRKRQSAQEDLTAAVFRAGYPHHPYSRPVIGSEENLQRISMADIDAFRRSWLHPGNAVLVLVGPADPDSMINQVKQAFDPLPVFDVHSVPEGTLPPRSHAVVVLDRYDFEGFAVSLGFRLTLHNEADRAMAHFLASFFEVHDARTSLKTLPGEAFLTVSSSFVYRERTWSSPNGSGSDQDAQAGISVLWQAIDMAILRLLDPDIFTEMRDQTLNRLARSARHPDYLIWNLGLDALNEYSPLSYDQLRSFLLEMDREEFQTFLHRELDASRVITGVLHGRDSGRMAQVQLPVNRAISDTISVWDPLASLTVGEIRPVLEVYAATPSTRITTFTLRNGIPVHILLITGSDRLELGGVRSFACLKDERLGKKQGIGLLYNLLVDHGYKSPARTYLDESPKYRPPFAARFDVLPFELRYHTQGEFDQAKAMSDVLVTRLDSDAFNLARWRRLIEGGSSSFDRMKRQPATQAKLYRWSKLFGEDHAVLGRWQGDPRTAEKIKYGEIQKFHRQVAKTGHTHLLAAGEADINLLADILNVGFGGRKTFEYYQSDPPPQLLHETQGAVFPAFDNQDVRLALSFPPLAIGGEEGPSWAAVRMMEEVLRMRLYANLRWEAGLIYTIGVVAQWGDGCIVPEVYTSCLPARAPEVLAMIVAELRDVATTGVDEGTMLKVQLQMVGHLFRQLADPAAGYGLLRQMVPFGEVPADPVAALLAISELELNTILARCIPPDRFVFSVTGPLFEEDIELFTMP